MFKKDLLVNLFFKRPLPIKVSGKEKEYFSKYLALMSRGHTM
jgi:hypothetical protein